MDLLEPRRRGGRRPAVARCGGWWPDGRAGGDRGGICRRGGGEIWWRLKWILLRQADDALDDKKLGIFQQHWHSTV